MNSSSTAGRQSLALLTDLYQLTMLFGYWKLGRLDEQAAFHLFFRRHPFQGGYTIACGLKPFIDYLQDLRFRDDDLGYLASLMGNDGKALFEPAFLDYLRQLEWSVDIDAVPEGTVVFPQQPLARVTGPILQCQLLETPLLNTLNFQSLIATKAARVCQAARGEPVMEFGLRRAQGMDGGITASRAAYVGGCDATSNVLAGKLFGIPVRGTHAHSWVMSFEDEWNPSTPTPAPCPTTACSSWTPMTRSKAFGTRSRPAGARAAGGHEMLGIRLDSGDLAYLSIEARRDAGRSGVSQGVHCRQQRPGRGYHREPQAAGSEDCRLGRGHQPCDGLPGRCAGRRVQALRHPSAPRPMAAPAEGIRAGGEDHHAGHSSGEAILSRRRICCRHDLGRTVGSAGRAGRDRPAGPDMRRRPIPEGSRFEDLLVPIFRGGKCVYDAPPLPASRARTGSQLASLHPAIRRLVNPHQYPAGLAANLHELKTRMVLEARNLGA